MTSRREPAGGAAGGASVGGRALGDVLVLDFSRVLAGPLATMLLADYGATVVKVERPGAGDDTRAWGPPHDAAGTATYFLSVNRNKRSLALDLRDPADLATAQALAARADVVVENFRPGVMERLRLDHATLSAANPGLVYATITGFGSSGEGAAMPGYDLLVQAVGGLMSVTGRPEDPQKAGVALVDVITGLFATTGILAALRHRSATGEGQRIEIDLLSSLLAALVNQASAYTAAGVVPGRMGNSHPSIAPYDLYAAGDATQLIVAVGNDRQFAKLCDVLGVPALAADPRFATNPARVAAREPLRALLEERLATAPAGAWSERLLAVGVPAGEVNDLAGAFALAQRLGLDPIAELPPLPTAADAAAPARVARNPVRMSASPPRHDSAPPALGELGADEALRLFGAD
ncbi:CaiB/BaiF CoA transferase family protein [Conexibacter woesei]|uniref:L-carnitine dehydratase/bile acid-inducible protein F n=1 Tax=Conexibacter woesei (strain DSM 14684 / CCUG 47730 / CIP 108061 / JCM 11494 / NBRC 100937 / ID131577) TaxID=469383 RepID=D3FCE6_CONWI|nr:CoA transferase [Conexibacter woesei]ADB49419.1 L-carnitine dehydratase/bile acid-inducible protein F [Conexibacter woesei DSM 14684]